MGLAFTVQRIGNYSYLALDNVAVSGVAPAANTSAGAGLQPPPLNEAMLGTPGARLTGHGLFDRVHVVDRPAYLTALSDAARQALAIIRVQRRFGLQALQRGQEVLYVTERAVFALTPGGQVLKQSGSGWHGVDGKFVKKSEWPTLGNLGKPQP